MGYTSHFGSSLEILAATGESLPSDSSELNAYKNANEGKLATYYQNNCNAYITEWWIALKGCNYNSVDSAAIIPKLLEICQNGSDINHPLGASSVKPGTVSPNQSFEQVLRDYN